MNIDIGEVTKISYRVSDIVSPQQAAKGLRFVVLKDTAKVSFGFGEYSTEEVGAYQTRMVAELAVQQLNNGKHLEDAA